MHAIELIPGIGKKLMWQILNQRDIKKLEQFLSGKAPVTDQ
jgi:predicted nucleic acid-binding OB-fold protein